MTVLLGTKQRPRRQLLRYEPALSHLLFQSVAAWTNDDLNLSASGDTSQFRWRFRQVFFTSLGCDSAWADLYRGRRASEGKPVIMLSDSCGGAGSMVIATSSVRRSRSIPQRKLVGVLRATFNISFMGPADICTPRDFEHSLMTPQLPVHGCRVSQHGGAVKAGDNAGACGRRACRG